MIKQMRVSERLLRAIKTDLARQHQFAMERVGFLFARKVKGTDVLIITDYVPLADEDYIPDDFVGARYSGRVIREAIERVIRSDECVFHIHSHEHFGRPFFSRTDLRSLKEMMPALHAINNRCVHGAVLLSNDEVRASIWNEKSKSFDWISNIQVCGFPLLTFMEENYEGQK